MIQVAFEYACVDYALSCRSRSVSDQCTRPIISVSDHGAICQLASLFVLGFRSGYATRLLRLTLDVTSSSQDPTSIDNGMIDSSLIVNV